MLKLSDADIKTIFDIRDAFRYSILSTIEKSLKNDITKWSPVWYAEALLEFAGFNLYPFNTDEEDASDKIWDAISNGTFNPIELEGNEFFEFNETPFYEPHLIDKENKLFPLGIKYSSSAPIDENYKFFISKLNEHSLELCSGNNPLYALILYGAEILSHIIGEELADLNAMHSAMNGYLKAKQGKKLIE